MCIGRVLLILLQYRSHFSKKYSSVCAIVLQVSSDEVIVTVDKRHLAGTDPTQATAGANQRVSFGAKYVPRGGKSSGYVLKEGSAAAGFKKKKGVLTVKIQYN